jgi:hypothetical protein
MPLFLIFIIFWQSFTQYNHTFIRPSPFAEACLLVPILIVSLLSKRRTSMGCRTYNRTEPHRTLHFYASIVCELMQVIAVARTADLVLMILDATKKDIHKGCFKSVVLTIVVVLNPDHRFGSSFHDLLKIKLSFFYEYCNNPEVKFSKLLLPIWFLFLCGFRSS